MLKTAKEFIVVGSGLAALQAARVLLDNGKRVTMIDVGKKGSRANEADDYRDFLQIRATDPRQYELFYGADLSGLRSLVTDTDHARSMTSGNRSFVTNSDGVTSAVTGTAQLTQSFAQGGLSESWGGALSVLSPEELAAIGAQSELTDAYKAVIADCGASGTDASFGMQPPAELDPIHKHLMYTYEKKKRGLAARGFELAQPPLALLTEPKDGRSATRYRDMDFWDNAGRSLYRGHFTLHTLLAHPAFAYVPNVQVTHIAETGTGAEVHGRDIVTGESRVFNTEWVMLGAGALNTARIVLASEERYDTPVPFAAKRNYLSPCLYLPGLSRTHGKRHSLCQLALTHTADGQGVSYTQLYSYRSLLVSKLLPYLPFGTFDSLRALAVLTPAIVLADTRLASGPTGTIMLSANGALSYQHDPRSDSESTRELRAVRKALRSLGLFPLMTKQGLPGSASHYAGGGLVTTLSHTTVVDSATWTGLPAQSTGLTLMAHARAVTEKLLAS